MVNTKTIFYFIDIFFLPCSSKNYNRRILSNPYHNYISYYLKKNYCKKYKKSTGWRVKKKEKKITEKKGKK